MNKIIDTTLIDRLTVLANKEKKLKEYKRRLRVKGNPEAILERTGTRFYLQYHFLVSGIEKCVDRWRE